MRDRIASAGLTVLLCLAWILPAQAQQLPADAVPPPPTAAVDQIAPQEVPIAPAFSAELSFAWDGWGLYGTLEAITPEMTAVIPCYSLDGDTYVSEAYNAWQLDPDDPDLLRQQCFWPMEPPLREYLSGEIDQFYLKLQITYADGSTADTRSVHFQREGPAPLPEGYQVEAWYAPSVRELQPPPQPPQGRYHFTISSDATSEMLTDLLPETVPVELQIYQPGAPTRYTAVVDYSVRWPQPQLAPDGQDTHISATQVVPPQQCTVTLGPVVYQLAPPEILPENGPVLLATFHPVVPGTASQLLLSTDNDANGSGIRATLPHRPTGAVAIVPEWSLDGQTGWTALADVLPSAPPEHGPPRFQHHSFPVLTSADAPLADYLARTIPGFYLRVRVVGGALDGVSAVTAWPADYDYDPPRDDSEDDGGGGNRGDAGSTGSGNVDSGGQRPGLPQDPTIPETTPEHLTPPPASQVPPAQEMVPSETSPPDLDAGAEGSAPAPGPVSDAPTVQAAPAAQDTPTAPPAPAPVSGGIDLPLLPASQPRPVTSQGSAPSGPPVVQPTDMPSGVSSPPFPAAILLFGGGTAVVVGLCAASGSVGTGPLSALRLRLGRLLRR